MAEEEKEKQAAARLGDWLDGKTRLEKGEDADLLDAVSTAAWITGVMGVEPVGKPGVADAFRKRLVREAGRAGARSTRPRRIPDWLRYAVAALIFFTIVPTGIWTLIDHQERQKLELIEKYDKMYVPYTARIGQGDSIETGLSSISGLRRRATEDMTVRWREARAERFFINFQPERSSSNE